MKISLKKTLTVILALASMLCLSFAPGAGATAEPVTLVWFYVGNGEQKDTKLVNDAVNEQLKSIPGLEHVTVKLMPQIGSDYNQALLLARAAGEQVDMMQTYGMTNPYDEIAKGNVIAMDDLISQYAPEIIEAIPEWMLDFGKVNGKQYFIPAYQQACVTQRFCTPADYLGKYGDPEKMRKAFSSKDVSLDEVAAMLEEYLLAIRAGEGNNAQASNFVDHVRQGALGSKYDPLVGNTNTAFSYFVDAGEVQHILLTDDMKSAYRIQAEWYDKGYIHPDILTYDPNDYNAAFGGANMVKDQGIAWTRNHNVYSLEDLNATLSMQYGFPIASVDMDDDPYITSRYAAGGTMIASSCSNPEEAIRWLSLMNTVKNGALAYNTVVYGIEGVHYEKLDGTHIRTLEYDGTQGGASTSYAAMKWIVGNTFNVYLNQGCSDTQNEFILTVGHGPDAQRSPLIGFVAESSAFQTEIEQVNAVVIEYSKGLLYGALGVDGWEDYFNEFAAKMEAAGAGRITAALQEQVDAFLASK